MPQSSKQPRDTLSNQDEEDLIWYAQQLCGMSIRAFGFDVGSPAHEVPTFPSWFRSFSANSESALARSVHQRLMAASELYAPAAAVLMALHDPAAIACDGKRALSDEDVARMKEDPSFRVREKMDVGRRLGVYPCTWTADEARRLNGVWDEIVAVNRMQTGLVALHSDVVVDRRGKRRLKVRKNKHGGQHPLALVAPYMTLSGRRATDLLTQMAAAKSGSKGDVAALWREVDAEAVILSRAAIRAWNEQPRHRLPRGVRRAFRTDKLTAATL